MHSPPHSPTTPHHTTPALNTPSPHHHHATIYPQEKHTIAAGFTVEGIHGGALVAVRSAEFLVFYDWEGRVVRGARQGWAGSGRDGLAVAGMGWQRQGWAGSGRDGLAAAGMGWPCWAGGCRPVAFGHAGGRRGRRCSAREVQCTAATWHGPATPPLTVSRRVLTAVCSSLTAVLALLGRSVASTWRPSRCTGARVAPTWPSWATPASTCSSTTGVSLTLARVCPEVIADRVVYARRSHGPVAAVRVSSRRDVVDEHFASGAAAGEDGVDDAFELLVRRRPHRHGPRGRRAAPAD
jgi:hypothetical protein